MLGDTGLMSCAPSTSWGNCGDLLWILGVTRLPRAAWGDGRGRVGPHTQVGRRGQEEEDEEAEQGWGGCAGQGGAAPAAFRPEDPVRFGSRGGRGAWLDRLQRCLLGALSAWVP